MRSRAVVPTIGVALALCTYLAVGAASTQSDTLGSPLHADGGWKQALLFGAIAAFVLYVLGLIVLYRGTSQFAVVAVVAVIVQVSAMFGPVLLSRDIYAYWAYGRVASAHHGNPYVDVPSAVPDDPAALRMGSSWLDTPSLYGPVFTVASVGIARAAGDSPRAAALFFRALATASMLSILAIVSKLGRNRAYAVAFVGWNPLLALHFAGGGHNDALMMALSLGALLLARRRHTGASGVVWALAIGVKWVALAFAVLVLLGQRFRDRRLLAGLIGGGLLVSTVATAIFGLHWLHALQGLSDQARRTGSIGLSKWLGDLGLGHRETLVVITAATVAAGVWLGIQAWRGRPRLGLAGVLLAALQGWLNPWYALWGVALAAPEEDLTAQVAAVVLSGLVLRDALPL